MKFGKLYALALSASVCLTMTFNHLNAQVQNEEVQMGHFMSGTAQYQQKGTNNQLKNNCTGQETYRSIDGTCNNLNNPEWGAVDAPLKRYLPAMYDSSNDLVGTTRANPRSISNIVVQDAANESSPDLSAFVFSWGQFIDHDVTFTPESEAPQDLRMIMPTGEEGDRITYPIAFKRSEAMPGTGMPGGPMREQMNITTSWVDASMVYGAGEFHANYLRAFEDGKLRTSTGNLLPYNTIDGERNSPIDPNAPYMIGQENGLPLFVAGDFRVNDQPGLLALHTLFVLEHNRICEELVASGMTNDEAIYLEARKKVSAIVQKITFEDFLPALTINLDAYTGYDATIQPDVANVFATAAYRIGHTMVTQKLILRNDDGSLVGPGWLMLRQAFLNPDWVDIYGIDAVLNGLGQMHQMKIDNKIVEELRSFLFFEDAIGGPGIDLAALNIQRGRDHGLDDYNAYRQYFLGNAATTFADINPDVVDELSTAYSDVNDIDIWVGLLSEKPQAGSVLGPSITAILKDQFQRVRDGDYYYYMNDPACTEAEREEINATNLSDVIKRNTEIENIQENVFYQERMMMCDVDYATLEINRQGALYGVTDIPTDGNEIYSWYTYEGNMVAQFTGNPYYSPSELGTYFLTVVDPDTECFQMFGPRIITSLDGCCELDDE